MFSPDILRLIFGYLDFESKQKRAVLVNKQWFDIIRDNSALSGHLVLRPPSGNATADEINEILKGWSGLTTLEIPSVNDMEKIKYAQCKMLKKVYVRTNIELNFWCHINKICFDPKVIQTPTPEQALECSASLIVKWEEDLTIESWDPFGKMKNLETLTIIIDCGEFLLSDFIVDLQNYCTQVSTIEITNDIPGYWDGYISLEQRNLDKFKNLETLVLKNCRLCYGYGISKPIHIKELHHINESKSFLNEDYISQYPQHFPSLEKLVIDQSGAPFSMTWKIENLTKILDYLASFKYIHLKITTEILLTDNFWFVDETDLNTMNIERQLEAIDMDVNEEDLDVEMISLDKMTLTVEKRHHILEKALEIIRTKFPIESEIELVDGRSGLSIVKEKWKQAQIQPVSKFKMAEARRLFAEGVNRW